MRHFKGNSFRTDIESHVAVIEVPEILLFSKLQGNSFSQITTISCSDSTVTVHGFGPKVALTCEITLKKYEPTIYFISCRLWNCVYRTPFLILNGFWLSQKSVFWHLREQSACSELTIQPVGNNMKCKYRSQQAASRRQIHIPRTKTVLNNYKICEQITQFKTTWT